MDKWGDVALGAGVVASLGAAALVLRSGLRRFRTADLVPGSLIHRQGSLRGYVVAVNDGDNVRVYHTAWLRQWARRPDAQRLAREGGVVKNSINVRLAGVDAPESAHFGNPGQPFASEARAALKEIVLGRFVRVQVHHRDPYGRLVGTVWFRSRIPFIWRNVSLELVKAGFATVYEGHGAVYGSYLQQYRAAEAVAQRERKGMWAQDNYVSPMEHKRLVRESTGLSIEAAVASTEGEDVAAAAPAMRKATAKRR